VQNIAEIVPGVFWVKGTLGSNIYIRMTNGGRPIVIDGGFPSDFFKIKKVLDRDLLSRPVLAVATHYHLDHVGSLYELKRRYGLKIAAHQEDANVIEGKEAFEIYKLDPFRRIYYTALSPFLFQYKHTHVELKISGVKSFLPGGELLAIHIPGHTIGSIALLDCENGILFSGDSVRNEKGRIEGPPPQFSTDSALARRALRERLIDVDFNILLPGHGEPIVKDAKKAFAGRFLRGEG